MNTPTIKDYLKVQPEPSQARCAVASGSAPYYLIIHGYSMVELQNKVNSTMQGGFRPMGGVLFSPAANEYIQAMLLLPNTKTCHGPEAKP